LALSLAHQPSTEQENRRRRTRARKRRGAGGLPRQGCDGGVSSTAWFMICMDVARVSAAMPRPERTGQSPPPGAMPSPIAASRLYPCLHRTLAPSISLGTPCQPPVSAPSSSSGHVKLQATPSSARLRLLLHTLFLSLSSIAVPWPFKALQRIDCALGFLGPVKQTHHMPRRSTTTLLASSRERMAEH